MKLMILFFSGTGNTDYVARYIAAGLTDQNIRTEVQSIEQMPADRVSDFDLLVLGFPVYACEAPRLFLEYIEHLEAGAQRGVFVYCTKGAFSGNAVTKVLRRMEQRGYVSFGGASVGMPGSDALSFVGQNSWMARAARNKDYDHLKQADALRTRVMDAIQQLAAGRPTGQLRNAPKARLTGIILGWFVYKLYQWLERRLRQHFWVDDRCSVCGYCVDICPTGNIRIVAEHPNFGNRCQLCLRCIHRCPQQAIQIGKHTVGKFRWQGPKGLFDPLQFRLDRKDD
jgi:NAD-dependent dihydropyrimidine dehydrogenase PreA subunit